MQNPYDPACRAATAADHFRDNLDMPNAIQLYESCSADMAAIFHERQEAAIKAGIPAFFSSFMPKSAGTFLHNRLLSLGALELFNHTPNPIDFTQAYLIEGWLRLFMKGGAACHSHMLPTPFNMRVMQAVGADRIWIHARDPRQAALSVYWHTEGKGQGEGSIGERRVAMERQLHDARRHVTHARGQPYTHDLGFDARIGKQFLFLQEWCVRWMEARVAYPRLQILFTTFEQMIEDREAFQDRV